MSSLHQRAKDVFLAALARPAADRPSFVATACTGDDALRQEVESLLAFHDEDSHDDGDTAHGESLAAEPAFTPGQVFAGRYRMIERLGRGGMGDVWRADDLVLKTGVALKLIRSTVPDARERILNEVRLARQITHPAVCRVFDVGEAEGGIFYTMELVRGEDLAALLKRVGRLPSATVADIGRQLCGGLAAAHGQGVLHRDLKPANILIDDDGLVRITDFGIAMMRTAAAMHALTGTPGYMAPEQRLIGTRLSERTDVYALGLVLYELLVGRHPFDTPGATSEPMRPSQLVPDVDHHLERVVMQALAADPMQRPESAMAMAERLPDIGTRRHATTIRPARPPRWRSPLWLTGAALAALIAVLGAASSFLGTSRGGTLTAQDTIVVADFENTTGEPVFDGAMKVALAVALEQSPFLKVFPDERARDTLRLMERSPDERVTRVIAREIARREQLKALIAGSIASLGRNYAIALEAINAETGDVMARDQAEAATKEEVLSALGTATSRLRTKLGESLASVQRFDVALPKATTPSIEALHAYSLALYEGREVPRLEAIPHLKRAIELDPTFAMAHAQLSNVYANTGQSALAPEYSRMAFELRERVSERERFFISWRYYRDATQAWDKALDLARAWTATYPREGFAFNSLGSALLRLGQFDQAVTALRESIRLDPKFSPAYANLAAALMGVGQFDEARRVIKDADERRLEFIGVRRLSFLLAFMQGDAKTMTQALESSVGVRETNAAFGWQAHTSAAVGRIKDAHEQFRRGIQAAQQGGFKEVAAQLTAEDAEIHAIVGQCDATRGELADGLELSRDNLTLERASRALAMCGATREASTLSTELAGRFPEAPLTTRVALPVTAAALALGRKDPAAALEELEGTGAYARSPTGEFWTPYLRGQAHLQMKDGKNALVEFKSIVDHSGEVPAAALYPLARLGLARATALTNDAPKARTEYESFFSLWNGADANLQPLTEARAEHARLR